MENLNGHEAGNGGHSQGDAYRNSPFLDPTVNLEAHAKQGRAHFCESCLSLHGHYNKERG